MKRQVLVKRCQGWDGKVLPNGYEAEAVQCSQPATQDGTHCPFHWSQKPVQWMAVTIDD